MASQTVRTKSWLGWVELVMAVVSAMLVSRLTKPGTGMIWSSSEKEARTDAGNQLTCVVLNEEVCTCTTSGLAPKATPIHKRRTRAPIGE